MINMSHTFVQCVKLLSTLAVLRLDERDGDRDDDDVESVLLSALMAPPPHQISSPDPLASHTWEKVN